MNRDRAKELTLVELAQAIESGKAIQVFYINDNEWASADFIAGGDSLRFITELLRAGHVRIKPEPREFWIVEVGIMSPHKVYINKVDALASVLGTDRPAPIHVIEVLD